MNNFQILPFKKPAHFWFLGQNCGNQLSCNFLLQFVWMGHIPLLKTQFALSAKQQHKLYLQNNNEVLQK